MEEAHRTHKEPAWGWVSVLLGNRTKAGNAVAKPATGATRRRGVVCR